MEFDDDELLFRNTPDANEDDARNDAPVIGKQLEKTEDTRVDNEVLEFVNNVLSGNNCRPITVGFVTESEAKMIKELTRIDVNGNRITMDADAVSHIEKRHGINGEHDHCMQNKEDIAKICYILSNYDTITITNNKSSKYKTKENKPAPHIIISKQMEDIYYIIEAVSDAKNKENHIVSMYKQI